MTIPRMTLPELKEWAETLVLANAGMPEDVDQLADFFNAFQIIFIGEQEAKMSETK